MEQGQHTSTDSGVYTQETLPVKPIVSEARGGGVSEESDGCLGCPIYVGPRSDYLSGKTGSHTLRQPGRPNLCGCQVLIPEGWRERISTSLPANAQSDQPRDHSAKTIKTKIIMVDFHQT